jgi:hypothetical protein
VYGAGPVSGGAPGGNVYGGRSGGGNVYGAGGGPVYGAPPEAPERGRVADRPGAGRYGAPPPGPASGAGGRGPDQYSGGQYSGGAYGAPADPYDGASDFGARGQAGPASGRGRPPAYPDEYGDYPS